MKYQEQESSIIEFKREIPQNEQIVKTIIGFCNQNGGRLILGVDNDGTIIGVDEEKVHQLMEYLEKTILEATFPPIICNIYTQRIAEKILLFIQVAEGMNKPYYLKREGKGVYIRLGRSTLRANTDIIDELKLESRGIFFDETPVYNAREDDLDKEKIKHFLQHRKSSDLAASQLTDALFEEALYAYKIITKEHNHVYPTVLGILLFGKKPQFFFPEARIMCNHFMGIEMGPEVVASKECLGTLDEQFNTAYNFVLSRLNRVWKIRGPKREEHLEIPHQAVREMIMNAIIHRNYLIPGPDKIAIFDNRIEIFSQGTFPGPLGNNLKAGFTYLRNPALCKIFREMGLIENFGFGFILTFSSYEKADLKAPEIKEGENFVKCILPRRTQNNLLKSTKAKTEANELTSILNLLDTATEISVSDVMQMVGLTRPTATRKLAELVKKGLLVKRGKGRGVRYSRS